MGGGWWSCAGDIGGPMQGVGGGPVQRDGDGSCPGGGSCSGEGHGGPVQVGLVLSKGGVDL